MIAILVLAAGASKRLARPKQLLPFRNTTLIQQTVKSCSNSNAEDLFIVTGAYRSEVERLIQDEACEIVFNKDWEEGLGKSIAIGMSKVVQDTYSGVIIVVGDQPYLTSEVLNNLIDKKSGIRAPIVQCKYSEGMGPPVYFDQKYFPDLCQLKGDNGAIEIVRKYKDHVLQVDFELGHIDVDVEEDIMNLREAEEKY